MAPRVPQAPRHLPGMPGAQRQVSERAGAPPLVRLRTNLAPIGAAAGAVARETQKTFGVIDRFVEQETRIADNVAVMDADNEMAELELQLRAKMQLLKGRNALGSSQATMNEYDQLQSQVQGRLIGVRQQLGGRRLLGQRRAALARAAEFHENREFNSWANQVETGKLATLTRDAQQDALVGGEGWQDRVKGRIDHMRVVINGRASRLGMGNDLRDEQFARLQSRTNFDILRSMANRHDIAGAREYLAKLDAGEMLPGDRAQAQKLIDRIGARVEVNQATDVVMEAVAVGTPDDRASSSDDDSSWGMQIRRSNRDLTQAEALDLVREQWEDSPLRSHIEREVKIRFREREIAQREAQAQARDVVDSYIEENRPVSVRQLIAGIGQEAWDNLDGQGKKNAGRRMDSILTQRRSAARLAMGLPLRRTPAGVAAGIEAYRLIRADQAAGRPLSDETKKKLAPLLDRMDLTTRKEVEKQVSTWEKQAGRAERAGKKQLGPGDESDYINGYIKSLKLSGSKKERKEKAERIKLELHQRAASARALGDLDVERMGRIVAEVDRNKTVIDDPLIGEKELGPEAQLGPEERKKRGLPSAAEVNQVRSELLRLANIAGKKVNSTALQQALDAKLRGDNQEASRILRALPDNK